MHKAHVHKRSGERRSVIGLLTRDFRGLPSRLQRRLLRLAPNDRLSPRSAGSVTYSNPHRASSPQRKRLMGGDVRLLTGSDTVVPKVSAGQAVLYDTASLKYLLKLDTPLFYKLCSAPSRAKRSVCIISMTERRVERKGRNIVK